MKNIGPQKSKKERCGNDTTNFSTKQEEKVRNSVPNKVILESLKKIPDVVPSHFYYNPRPQTRKETDNSCCTCLKTGMESSKNICNLELPQKTQNQLENQELIKANVKLTDEVSTLKKLNKALKEEKVHLKQSLNNLRQQFNFVIADYENLQKTVEQYKKAHSVITQRLAFSEQKLDKYVADSFEKENEIQDLVFKLSTITREYETKINHLKLQVLAKPQTDNLLNRSAQGSLQGLECSLIGQDSKGDTSETQRLKTRIKNQDRFLIEIMSGLQNLFKDRKNAEQWEKMRHLFKQHTNHFVLGTAANTEILEL